MTKTNFKKSAMT